MCDEHTDGQTVNRKMIPLRQFAYNGSQQKWITLLHEFRYKRDGMLPVCAYWAQNVSTVSFSSIPVVLDSQACISVHSILLQGHYKILNTCDGPFCDGQVNS